MSAPRRSLAPTVRPVEAWAWAMYDFANSSYTTIVITALFNAYFVAVVAERAPWATLAWTSALAVSYALTALAGPVVGAYADAHAKKKRLLFFSTLGCVIFTALLALTGPGTLALAVACVIVSNFFFGMGENLIAAFLPELAESEAMARVSGWGWSFGYLGGLTALGLCLAYLSHMQEGGGSAAAAVPDAMIITAALFAAASLPTFAFLRERARPQTGVTSGFRSAWVRLLRTAREARAYRDLARFLVCTVFYQAGIQAVITLAAIYAQEAMHFSTTQTLILILAVNITAAIGAFFFGYAQDRLGHVRTIGLTLIGWLAMVLIAWSAQGVGAFWVAANVAGICMGASQSGGRALVGYLAPRERLAEFFGLWGFATRLAAIIGPLTYGLATWISGGDHRQAILVTGSFFVVGLLLLAGIDAERGRRAAIGGPRGETALDPG